MLWLFTRNVLADKVLKPFKYFSQSGRGTGTKGTSSWAFKKWSVHVTPYHRDLRAWLLVKFTVNKVIYWYCVELVIKHKQTKVVDNDNSSPVLLVSVQYISVFKFLLQMPQEKNKNKNKLLRSISFEVDLHNKPREAKVNSLKQALKLCCFQLSTIPFVNLSNSNIATPSFFPL